MTTTYYLTTSIPYVNATPHLGFALEIVLADAIVRGLREVGADVRFLTGTDENSLSNVRAAEKQGVPTKELVDSNAQAFQSLGEALDLSYDDFIRTSADPRHVPGVHKLWEACARNGDIYRKAYRGLYCVGCELFYEEDDLVEGLCPEHEAPPEVVEEENWFFRLSKYQDLLLRLIEGGELRIEPETRRNEAVGLIRTGLEDISISRTIERARGWGVPVPGDPTQVVYVWFDALANYLNGLGFAEEGPLYQRYWLDTPNRIHVIGKSIVRQHAVYWPAFLLSAAVPLPTLLYVHGFINFGGRRLSKSLGNVIDPFELVNRYGCDAVRYALLRKPTGRDQDFTEEELARAYKSELAGGLGNLVSRVTALLEAQFEGRVPTPAESLAPEQRLAEAARASLVKWRAGIERFAPHRGLAAAFDLVAEANRYIVRVAPWAESRRDRRATALYHLVEVLRWVSILLRPYLPSTAGKIGGRLGAAAAGPLEWAAAQPGVTVSSGAHLFPALR